MNLQEIEQFVIGSGSDDLPTFGGSFEGGIHCQQIPDEIAPCIHAILESKKSIDSYLEIGVAAGGTTYLINHFFQPESIVLIDDNKHHKARLRDTILNGIDRKELIGRSDEEGIIQQAAQMGSYDMIMIDGDHNYPGVKLDAIHYSNMLSSKGFLVFHDSNRSEWGVERVVREMKANGAYKFIGEFISEKHHSPLGIAVFRKVR